MRKSLNKKPSEGFRRVSNWVQGLDLNQRPSGYEPVLPAIEQQKVIPENAKGLAESLGTQHDGGVPCCPKILKRKGGHHGAGN